MREAVAVFDDAVSLEGAVAELKERGFADEDLSILGSEEAIEEKLGHSPRQAEDAEDDPSDPREQVIPAKELAEHERTLANAYWVLPTLLGAGAVVATTGPLAALVVGAVAGGTLLSTALAGLMDARYAEHLDEQLERGRVLLWVRTPDSDREQVALEVLQKHAGRDVHVHELRPEA
ncbi:MAG TPA: hypothetical protein VNS22_07485 [Geminicoccus sp.]|uniref:hypothetical protein n=1 Tax=Geminicoccus sp. TaxID=2024832 RepID=UPI002C7F09AE|nr:hypothetical protein [Geminicoccus sp.]HWL68213.1 hypothetical protein [Geminicoccus sp.]